LHALNTLRDLRDLTSAGIFDIVRMAARTWQHRRAPYDWPLTTRFLDHEILEGSGTGLGHDWLRPPTQALRGKRIHIARLIPLQADGNIFPRDRFGPLVLPLLAQPIVELCLSIPTWMWCAGGRDRSVARQAFADLLPHAIVQRRSKGGPDNFACQVIERNKAQLRDMLLNGQLARHGLLDVASVASALADIGAVHGKDHLRLAALAEAEAWAASWAA
jgi:asparagine synthase (glutamine-hydrolysing)